MSLFVQLPPADYSRTAFDKFMPLWAGFDLDDARAMMWMSQLAYETDAPQTIATVGPLWGFKSIAQVRAQGEIDTRVLIGDRPDCIVVAFAGTDPALSKNLITDADCRLTPNDTHEGFQAAIDAAWADIETKITALIAASPRPIFFTGQPRRGISRSRRRKSERWPFGAGKGLHLRHAARGRPEIQNSLRSNPRRSHVSARSWRRHGSEHSRFHNGARDARPVSACRPSADMQLGRQVRPERATLGYEIERPALPRWRARQSPKSHASAAGRTNLRIDRTGALGRFYALLPFGIRDHLPHRYLRALEP